MIRWIVKAIRLCVGLSAPVHRYEGIRSTRRTLKSVRCPLCGDRMPYDRPGGIIYAFADYVCPRGHYEWHFDCGTYSARVEDKKWTWSDSLVFKDEKEEEERCREEIASHIRLLTGEDT